MNILEKNLVTALAELAILKKTKNLDIPLELLQLAAALRQDQQGTLVSALDNLHNKEKLVENWKIRGNKIKITLSSDFPLPNVSEIELKS